MPRKQGNHKITYNIKKVISEAIEKKIIVRKDNNKVIFQYKTNTITFHCGDKGIYDLYRRFKKLGIELKTLTKICKK